jgi:hypothetical protein
MVDQQVVQMAQIDKKPALENSERRDPWTAIEPEPDRNPHSLAMFEKQLANLPSVMSASVPAGALKH